MESWILEQLKFKKTIYLYNKNNELIFAINPVMIYRKSLLNFIEDHFDPTCDKLFSDYRDLTKKLSCEINCTYFPYQNNPLDLKKIFDFLEEFGKLLDGPDLKKLGTSEIFPNEVMDKIWAQFYSDLIVERINKFFSMIVREMDLIYEKYYIYYFLCWLERNFYKFMEKINLNDNNVKVIMNKLNYHIIQIKLEDFRYENGCPQFKEFVRKWEQLQLIL